MKKEFDINNKKQHQELKRYQKGIKNIIVSIVVFAIGAFGMSTLALKELLHHVFSNDLSILLTLLIKSGLMVGSIISLIDSLANTKDASIKINNLDNEQEEIVARMKELETSKEINKSLSHNKDEIVTNNKDIRPIKALDNEYKEKRLHKVKI